MSAAFHNPPKDICHDANNYLAITSIVVAAPLLTAAVQKPYTADYLLGVEGQDAKEVISRLEGIQCGFNPTSCPDQLAQALKQALNEA